jgi:hypothetical protein
MNRTLKWPVVVVFGLILFLAGVSAGPTSGWAQGEESTPSATPTPSLPAVHPLYGDCGEDGEENGTIPSPTPDNGTVPPTPVFEPFLPNSIYVDWCGHALLTIALSGTLASTLPASSTGFDPAVGHRIGLFYSTDEDETGWRIANYSYRVDFTADELEDRKVALLRELCPLGNICNEILLAKLGKLGAEFSLLNENGEQRLAPVGAQTNRVFAPYVSNAD